MKYFFKTVFLLTITFCYSQQNSLWQGYFSYNSIKDLSQSTSQVYAAADNAYFKKDILGTNTTKVSSVEGLSGQEISQIYHSDTFKKTILGHTDGLVIVVNDVDGAVLNIVDILNKPSVPQNKKKINHFTEYQGKIYIATDFGVTVFDMNTLSFGDTYFVGPGGSNIEILQTTIFNGFIYAVAVNYGLIKASITNTNLIDFNQWTLISPGGWLSVQAMSSQLTAITTVGSLYKFNGDTPIFVATYPQVPVDTRFNTNFLIITTPNAIYAYNESLVEISRVTSIPTSLQAKFTCATIISDKLYIGTKENGVFSTTLNNPVVFENITPNSPVRNKIFAIQTYSKGLWAVYGDYSGDYNPYPLDALGVSKYDSNNLWTTTPYESLFDALSITRIAINPKNENQVYFSSNYSGLLKFENNLPSIIYNASNSSLQSIIGQIPNDIRTNGSGFDKSGNLWMTNSLVANGLQVLKTNGQWQGFPLTGALNPSSISFGRLAIDKNDTKWLVTNYSGLVGFNENYNNRSLRIDEGESEGNLPTRDVRAVAIDNTNKIWIGTTLGLRVLQSADSFLTQDNLKSESIIIVEDGLAQELLYEQFITDIVVDGANNKWIGTNGAGVFFISPDGQQTYNIFTKENSPLPSNVINDIDINAITGEVYIATEFGLVSYKGFATKGAENLDNVYAFPNPVRPEFNGVVSITGLTDKANVKITDIEGNLVHEANAEGGTILWDTKAFGKYKVVSGVYMIFVSTEDGLLTKTKKVMIIR
ncbi:T9SS type A sorting domain-containing protein [Flavobacterium sp.]|uniref:type IX secretion system anionic LPS delivery protein PorZ n=1 Tax=Flavobacterium sp. TaxID=239 RepID=UPI00286E5162|nr:T9SS type A sorting domain-containing protein [Flavobacterium sp.]